MEDLNLQGRPTVLLVGAGVAGVMIIVASLATVFPATRAAAVDPVSLLAVSDATKPTPERGGLRHWPRELAAMLLERHGHGEHGVHHTSDSVLQLPSRSCSARSQRSRAGPSVGRAEAEADLAGARR